MKRREFLQATIAGAVLACGTTSIWAADATQDPEQWILALSNEMLDLIRQDAKLIEGDPERVREFVKTKAMPVVDFERMTRMCVGPKWRTATPEQRQELQDQFREQLTRVYSGALATVKDQTVQLAPSRVKPTPTDAVVRTLLVAPGKPEMHINYRLKKVKGEWRIIDVDVEGIWLVANYRQQFASVVNASGIEGLIKTLKQKNGQASE